MLVATGSDRVVAGGDVDHVHTVGRAYHVKSPRRRVDGARHDEGVGHQVDRRQLTPATASDGSAAGPAVEQADRAVAGRRVVQHVHGSCSRVDRCAERSVRRGGRHHVTTRPVPRVTRCRVHDVNGSAGHIGLAVALRALDGHVQRAVRGVELGIARAAGQCDVMDGAIRRRGCRGRGSRGGTDDQDGSDKGERRQRSEQVLVLRRPGLPIKKHFRASVCRNERPLAARISVSRQSPARSSAPRAVLSGQLVHLPTYGREPRILMGADDRWGRGEHREYIRQLKGDRPWAAQ